MSGRLNPERGDGLFLLAAVHLLFFVFYVLAYDGVVLAGLQLFRRLARILAVNVEVAGVSRADEFDLYAGGLGHDYPLRSKSGRENSQMSLQVKHFNLFSTNQG